MRGDRSRRPARAEIEHPHPAVDHRRHLGRMRAEGQPRPRPQLAPRPHERLPSEAQRGRTARRRRPQEEHFRDAAARLAPAAQPGRHDARFVEHEQVAGPQQVRQLRERAVLQVGSAAIQEPARIAPRGRIVGDQLRRKRVVVGGSGAQVSRCAAPPTRS